MVSLPLVRLSGLAASLATVALLISVNDVAENWSSVTRGTPGFIIDASQPGTWWLFPWGAAAIVVDARRTSITRTTRPAESPVVSPAPPKKTSIRTRRAP